MLELKKYDGATKKLTIAELILSAVTFFFILFLFVLPCFKASVSLDGISLDILLLKSENAEQKIFYDKVREALRAEIANGNDPEIVTFSFSLVEEIRLMIGILKSGTPGPDYLFNIVLFIPVSLGATYLFMCACNIVKSCKKLFVDDIGNATLLFFNDIKTSSEKKTKKSAYEQYQAFNFVIVIAMILFVLRSLSSLVEMPSFVSHISGIAAAGYFALLLAIVACGFNFYTPSAIEDAVPAANADERTANTKRAIVAAKLSARRAKQAGLLSGANICARRLRAVCANACRNATATNGATFR